MKNLVGGIAVAVVCLVAGSAPSGAVVYCKWAGYPKGCVARPTGARGVGAGARGVGVTPGVGVGAPGVGVTRGVGVGAPGYGYNGGGPVNRVGPR
jgi:hypothetical protein